METTKTSTKEYIQQAENILVKGADGRPLSSDDIALAAVYASLAQARALDDIGSYGVTVDVERFPVLG